MYEKRERDLKAYKKEISVEQHRIAMLERESQKWRQMDEEAMKEEAKLNHHRENFQAGKRNANG